MLSSFSRLLAHNISNYMRMTVLSSNKSTAHIASAPAQSWNTEQPAKADLKLLVFCIWLEWPTTPQNQQLF